MKLSCLDFQFKVSNTIVTTRLYVLFFHRRTYVYRTDLTGSTSRRRRYRRRGMFVHTVFLTHIFHIIITFS